VQRECQEIRTLPTVLAEWIELKETLAKFQAERGNETSDDKGSNDTTSKAERKQKSDASPVDFCRRSLAGGNIWDSLADLLKIMKLRGVGADDVKEVREMLQHLRVFTNIVKPAHSKRDSRQAKMHVDNLLFQLVDDMLSMSRWNTDSFLNRAQEIIAGGFVRIQDSSQVWEERVDEARIITTEGLPTCLDPGRGLTIISGGWNFLKKQECWEGHEQALITTIRKETKQTEELDEAEYRSPTWAVLRALQQINSATRIEGEAAMSAPPFFQSAGRGNLLFWGGKEGPTVVTWESLSEQGKKSWLEKASTMPDWVMWCKSQKGAEEIRSFELSG